MKKILNQKGFTLLELMVVVVIMLILATIAIPTLNNFTGEANEARLVSDARTLLLAAEAKYERDVMLEEARTHNYYFGHKTGSITHELTVDAGLKWTEGSASEGSAPYGTTSYNMLYGTSTSSAGYISNPVISLCSSNNLSSNGMFSFLKDSSIAQPGDILVVYLRGEDRIYMTARGYEIQDISIAIS